MSRRAAPDAVVVGAGPNGLVAALTLARAGWSVEVLEAARTAGGGTRTGELTLPGFRHDVCSAIHPLAIASPALRDLGLEHHGVEWIHPDAPLAHVLRPDRSVLLERSVGATAGGLGPDADAWERLLGPPVRAGLPLVDTLLAPRSLPRSLLRSPAALPATVGFGLTGLRSAAAIGRSRFRGEEAPALLAGLAAHSILPLDAPVTGAFGLLLGQLAHLVGWPMARGGSQAVADALVALLTEAGGTVTCDRRVASLDDLPPCRAVLLDVTPRQLLAMAGHRIPPARRRALQRFRHGPGVCKVDWALAGPVPWLDPATARAGTVHLGGTLEEVRAAEDAVHRGRHAERPFVLLAQQSRFDPSRAPAGHHTLWAYCHVPHGSGVDVSADIESVIEAAAPGFRDLVLDRHVMTAVDVERHDANYVGGDINGGTADLRQFLFRPTPSLHPWSTPAEGVWLCSSSTPPGGGVHGMCGAGAARAVLRHHRR